MVLPWLMCSTLTKTRPSWTAFSTPTLVWKRRNKSHSQLSGPGSRWALNMRTEHGWRIWKIHTKVIYFLSHPGMLGLNFPCLTTSDGTDPAKPCQFPWWDYNTNTTEWACKLSQTAYPICQVNLDCQVLVRAPLESLLKSSLWNL